VLDYSHIGASFNVRNTLGRPNGIQTWSSLDYTHSLTDKVVDCGLVAAGVRAVIGMQSSGIDQSGF